MVEVIFLNAIEMIAMLDCVPGSVLSCLANIVTEFSHQPCEMSAVNCLLVYRVGNQDTAPRLR